MRKQVGLRFENAHRHKELRRKMLAKIHIEWKGLRPDLRHSSSELREGLLDFATAELNVQKLGSLSELTSIQLGRVLDAMSKMRNQPQLPGCEKHHVQPVDTQAELIHLASNEQRWAIARLFNHLGWSLAGRAAFLQRNFRREKDALLTQKQAHSCIRILLNIAVSHELKQQFGEQKKISQTMKRAAIPQLKSRLGIGG